MKNFYNLFLVFFLSTAALMAQSPNAVNYQAVLRNSQGAIIKNQSVSLRLSVLQGSSSGSSVYSETHSLTTNGFGQVNMQIGNGSTTGDFSTVDWGANSFYLKVEIDETGGTTYKNLGTSQFVSVPYAKFATTAMNVINDDDSDSTNELQTITLSGNFITLSGNNSTVALPAGSEWTKDTDSLTYGKFVRIGDKIDGEDSRLSVASIGTATDNVGIYAAAGNGTATNYAINAEMKSNTDQLNDNAAVRGYANTDDGGGTAFRGELEGDLSGTGAAMLLETGGRNIAYVGTVESQTGTAVAQYGAVLSVGGANTGDNFGILSFADGVGPTTPVGGSANYGGYFQSGGTGKNFGVGVWSDCNSNQFLNIGAIGFANQGSGAVYNYGLYGVADSASTLSLAGYFDGDVTYTGTLTGPSDARLKSDVGAISGTTSTLDKIMTLEPVSYNYKLEEYDFMNLPEGKQFGFIAQELKKVFPELVNPQAAPILERNENFDPNDPESDSNLKNVSVFEYQGVNYIGMIPVLTEGIQEQQAQIEDLKGDIEELKKQNAELKAMVEQLIQSR